MRGIALLCLMTIFILPVSALEIEAPAVPKEAADRMPEDPGSLDSGLPDLAEKAMEGLYPDLREGARISLGILAVSLMISMIPVSGSAKKASELAGVAAAASLVLGSSGAMIPLGAETVGAIADYGKLLLPVMTSALAAQGSVTASAALCAGTAMFTAVLESLLEHLLLPGVWLYLALRTGYCATGEALLGKLADLIKSVTVWCMKILMMVFTTYLSLTGVLSGTTDAAALKAAKVSISTFVPVVGGALSDASEAVLLSAGMMKNAAGLYGIFAVLALFLQPFLRIGIHYLMLKFTAAVSAIFGPKPITDLMEGFAAGMGMILGMTACGCVMVLISTVCFLKGGTA